MRQEPNYSARGILSLSEARKYFSLDRALPDAACSSFIEHYWQVSWDLGSRSYIEENIPYPSVHLTWENDPDRYTSGRQRVLTGVWPRNYVRKLSASGSVFGVKFRPAVFRGILGRKVSDITGKTLLSYEANSPFPANFGADIFDAADFSRQVEIANQILSPLLTDLTPLEVQLRDYIELIETQLIETQPTEPKPTNPTYAKLPLTPGLQGYSARQLQRLFLEYAGISIKWIQMRARIRHAVDLLSAIPQADVNLADMAQRLGYYDQAHFSNDFKNLTGKTPLQYAKQESSASEG